MAQLDVLIRKRSGMKAKLTNFSNYISSIGASGIISELQHELQCRLNKYEALYDQFDELQVEIEVCSDKPEDEYEERSKFEERYYALMAQARNLLCRDGAADDGRSVAGSICKQAAMVKVIDDNGNSMDARLLLDNGSTANFITQSLCSKLKLSTRSPWAHHTASLNKGVQPGEDVRARDAGNPISGRASGVRGRNVTQNLNRLPMHTRTV
ncbi:uncharacterized protein LOC123720921 isoform X2 [Papilio machaon]|uniref:uncharacterized protein LOC123720921 isoform X2 n=1 Tax=Papilio machaon TaxID=76193 RepID=UPI001E663559|nr:uncharacterized protein LOC123720921 isoform X2 [Papilio machaon]